MNRVNALSEVKNEPKGASEKGTVVLLKSTEAEAKVDNAHLFEDTSEAVKSIEGHEPGYIKMEFLELKDGNFSYSDMNSEVYIAEDGDKKTLFIKRDQPWQAMPQKGDVLHFGKKKVFVGAIPTFDILYPEEVLAMQPVQEAEKEKTFDQLMLEKKMHPIDPKKPKSEDGTLIVNKASEVPINSINSTPAMVRSGGQVGQLAGLEVTGQMEAGMASPSAGASIG